jgi:5,10-methylenetetrahydrofolate reductase
MSKLKEALESGKFVITSEIGPPKGVAIEKCLHEAGLIKDRVTAINVTDNQSSVMRFGSLAICRLLIEKGMEPVFQMTCRDRNRLALQSDLLSAYGLAVENVLCLTGDHVKLGDDPKAKAVFDLDAVQLLKAAQGLNEGKDMAGHDLEGKPNLFLGAVVNPGAYSLDAELIKMEKKIKAGARFFQTQAVYEPDKFANFMKAVSPFKVPVEVGIVVLKSVGMARYMNEHVSGVFVPEPLINELKKDKEKTKSGQTGIEISARLIKEMKDMCQGVHLMPLGWDDKVPAILDLAGL